MDRQQWLEARRTGIGASDASAILDFCFPGEVRLNPRRTAFDVFLDKIGKGAEAPVTDSLELGCAYELPVGETYSARTGRRVRHTPFHLPRHTGITRFADLVGNKKLMADLTFVGPKIAGSAEAFRLQAYLRQLKYDSGQAPIEGAGVVAETWPFRCFQPAAASAGMPTPSIGADNSEVMIATYDACPFNFLMGQNDAF